MGDGDVRVVRFEQLEVEAAQHLGQSEMQFGLCETNETGKKGGLVGFSSFLSLVQGFFPF